MLELIDQRFGIRLAVTTVGRYLRAWGFTPQVPAHQALERDPAAAVKQWLAVRYPEIREKDVGVQFPWFGARVSEERGERAGGLVGGEQFAEVGE